MLMFYPFLLCIIHVVLTAQNEKHNENDNIERFEHVGMHLMGEPDGAHGTLSVPLFKMSYLKMAIDM
jgi:hypothetical protein